MSISNIQYHLDRLQACADNIDEHQDSPEYIDLNFTVKRIIYSMSKVDYNRTKHRVNVKVEIGKSSKLTQAVFKKCADYIKVDKDMLADRIKEIHDIVYG